MRRYFIFLYFFVFIFTASARHQIKAPDFKSLQVLLNNDFTALPVMTLESDDVLSIGFDQLSHDYHRLIYQLELCNPDWTPCNELFESDWLEGFNGRPIDEYVNSLNTTVLYTHYEMHLPNNDTRLKMSGNYRLHIIDEDEDDREVMCIELRVVEPLMDIGLQASTNTDIDLNLSHQQIAMRLNYGSLRVTNANEQIQTFVMQNGREDNMKVNVRPNYQTPQGLTWEHNRGLIFEAGNEYHKFEVLDPTHTTMGLAWIKWNEAERRFHTAPYPVEPRRSYILDVDTDGAFLIRNSDNVEIDYTSDYVYVHYQLKPFRHYPDARILIDGWWTTEPADTYTMTWNEEEEVYEATIMQKLGYYNYQFLMADLDGTTHRMPEEGSFFQTENRYEAFVYYRGTGERSWRLVGFNEITLKP